MINNPCLDLQPVNREGDTYKNLELDMQEQSQTQWCWAACGASIGDYYHGQGTYSQCGVANLVQAKTTCCENPSGCNQPAKLDDALKAADSYQSMVSNSVSFDVLVAQIDANKPVGTRVGWYGGGGHFMAISGYNSKQPKKITIKDPWYGQSVMDYDKYPAQYNGGGNWTHTYYTTKESAS